MIERLWAVVDGEGRKKGWEVFRSLEPPGLSKGAQTDCWRDRHYTYLLSCSADWLGDV